MVPQHSHGGRGGEEGEGSNNLYTKKTQAELGGRSACRALTTAKEQE